MPVVKALDEVTVLVTRPAHQAEKLCHLIEDQGGTALRFPVIEIAEPRDSDKLNTVIGQLNEYNIAIFISPNAVERAYRLVMDHGGWPDKLKIAAVGKGSAKALEKKGMVVDFFPDQQFNSEALLAMEDMQSVSGKRIVIFRGEGGRELLADTLRSRGARVDYAECYRRVKPDTDASELKKHLSSHAIDVITVTSDEGLQNLYDMVDSSVRPTLLHLPLVVVSERTKKLSQALGFQVPAMVAKNASDDMLVQALINWKQQAIVN